MNRIYVFDTDDGQALVTIFPDGYAHLAFRKNSYGSWGPPMMPIRAEGPWPVPQPEKAAS